MRSKWIQPLTPSSVPNEALASVEEVKDETLDASSLCALLVAVSEGDKATSDVLAATDDDVMLLQFVSVRKARSVEPVRILLS